MAARALLAALAEQADHWFITVLEGARPRPQTPATRGRGSDSASATFFP
jgi:hypothetical protein